MSPTIRIDDDVYETLKAHAEPFVDTPNSVLRRLLQLSATSEPRDDDQIIAKLTQPTQARIEFEPPIPEKPASRKSPNAAKSAAPTAKRAAKTTGRKTKVATKKTRAPRGSLLPEEEYDEPLLRTLEEHGGSASFKELVAGVEEKLGDRLTDIDRANLNSGAVRWENRLQFVRLRLIQQGLMEKDSPRGVWAITDEGRELLSNRLSVVA